MRSLIWRIVDSTSGAPGPILRAYGDPAPVVTGLAPGTAFEVDRGDGVWWPGIVPGVPSTPAVTLTLTPAGPIPADAPAGTVVASITGLAPAHATLTLTGADAALLAISDGQIVTAAALTGRASLLVSVSASASGYTPAPRSAAVTVQAVTPPDPDPVFVVSPDATFAISPDPASPGVWQFEVTAPAYAAGSYSITEAELAEGPAALNEPVTTGTIATGQRLVTTGVVAVGIGGAISVDYEMRRNGVALAAGDPLNYEIVPGDQGATLQVVALLSDANGGPVEVPGNAVPIPADALPVDTFGGVSDATHLAGVISDSGEAWARADGSSTKSMEIWWGRAFGVGTSRIHYLRGAADRGVRQWAECDIGRPTSLDRGGPSPLARGTAANGIFVQTPRLSLSSTFVVIQKIAAASTTLFSFEAPPGWADAAANVFRLRIEVDGAAVEAFVNGVSVGTGTTSLSGGGCGLSTGDFINNRVDSGFADNFACGGSN